MRYIIFTMLFVLCSCADEPNIVINGKVSKGVWFDAYSGDGRTFFMLVNEGYIVRNINSHSMVYIPGEPPLSWVDHLIEKSRQAP